MAEPGQDDEMLQLREGQAELQVCCLAIDWVGRGGSLLVFRVVLEVFSTVIAGNAVGPVHVELVL